MTKAIRIENTDTSDHKVVVQIWDKGKKLENGEVEPDLLFREITLDCPTMMVEQTIWSTRYLVIKEV